MYSSVSYKAKQFFALVIKLAIVIGATYFIYHKLMHNPQLDFNMFLAHIQTAKIFTIPNIAILVFATCANWFFEILKWKQLVSHIQHISFMESARQSLGGLTASLFTPNRVGEYGVKAMYFSKPYRKRILGLNFLGNCAQMIVTTILGVFGFSFFVYHFSIELPWHKIIRGIALLLLFGVLFFVGAKQKKFQIKGYSWQNLKRFIKSISWSIHRNNISLAFVRYAIFAHQFYFLLFIFGVNHQYVFIISTITAMYLITSLIPMLFIFDVIVKGSVAVWLFGYLGIDEFTVLSVITLMWILNFVFPSIVGSYFVMNFNTSLLEEETNQA